MPAGHRRKGHTPKQRVNERDRARKVLDLARDGHSFDVIAERLGYASRAGAHHAFTRALLEVTKPVAEELLKLELERLDKMFAGLTRKGAFAGNPKAVMAALRIMERRAKYLNLDAPIKHELTGKDGGPVEVAGLTDEQLLALAAGAYPTAAVPDGGGGARTAPSLAGSGAARPGADADTALDAADAPDASRPAH